MTEPRIVTPQEAREWIDTDDAVSEGDIEDLLGTVATEPDRTRAAVVKALRRQAKRLRALYGSDDIGARTLDEQTDAIENGVDW